MLPGLEPAAASRRLTWAAVGRSRSLASSARVALILKRLGIQRVFPLEGGLEAWIAAGYPVDLLETLSSSEAASGTATSPNGRDSVDAGRFSAI